ncbi:MAG: AmmeMemoRadiSam system protein A [Spirochaeta sp.]|jgi:AmmeMemoRadiSam system protein A|nr:AmmeMemoRadiSam system protein A [Spirochaeta sp.]
MEHKNDLITQPVAARLLTYAEAVLKVVILGGGLPAPPEEPLLQEEYGAFSTLRKDGELRGCIGNFAGTGPLDHVIPRVVEDSALRDARFSAVTADELPHIDLSLSILFPAYPVASAEDIVLGRDGTILSLGRHRAVFLPEVATEQRWDRTTMLDRLCQKARLAPGAWQDPEAALQVFQTVHISRSPDDPTTVITE